MKHSVTSVFLPHLTMVEQAQLLSKLGYDGIELRVRYCTDEARAKAIPSAWGYHVNDVTPDNFKEKAPEINKILQDNGLTMAGLATNMSCVALEEFKKVLEGAVATNAPFIRLGAADRFFLGKEGNYEAIYGDTVGGFARCIELAKGTGIKMLIETHGNTIHPSVSLAMRICRNFAPSQIGIIFDPQNMDRDGMETPELSLQQMGEYWAHCHFGAHRPEAGEPDENGTIPWTWKACPLNEGIINFPYIISLLKKHNYDKFITIEDFDATRTPEDRCEQAITYLKKLEAL